MKLYGKNPVIERLRANPKSIRRIFLQRDFKEAGYIHKKARKWGISVVPVLRSKLSKIARNLNTQGIVADVDDFMYTDYDDVLSHARQKKYALVFLDGLNDPQNLGGILRTLACLGNFSLVLPTHDSVSITETVLRVASGGESYVPVARVANLGRAIRKAKEHGFFIVGTAVDGGDDISSAALTFPIGVVIGSEQKGMRAVIRSKVDSILSIPMKAETVSFNVAHATAIFCYEIHRQRKKK